MIKKYNQFIKEDVYQDRMYSGSPEISPAPTKPDTKPSPGEKPSKPGPIPGKRQSPVPAPAKAMNDDRVSGEYYHNKLQELSNMLGVKMNDMTNTIDYEGKNIIFPSETGMYHVDGKKFETPEEVVDYLGLDEEDKEYIPNEEIGDMEEDEEVYDYEDDDEFDTEFESKSYKKTRKFGKRL